MESILVGLEEEVRKISRQGGEFQGKVESLTKSDTGSPGADLVSQADYWLQEHLLNLFAQTDLRYCQVVAEEASEQMEPLLARFAETSDYQIFLDPLDGTRRFLEGLPYFSTIVSLRHRHQPVYSFCYYPKLDWWIRLYQDHSWEVSGSLPLSLPRRTDCVVYTSGSPSEDFADWQGQASELEWLKGDKIHPCGSKLLYLSGSVAGYASAKPNLYDGLMIYHFAKVRRHRMHTSLDLSHWEDGPRGLFHPGRYLCWQPGCGS